LNAKLVLIVLSALSLPVAEFASISNRTCEGEVGLGLALKKGPEDVLCDQHG